MNDNRLLARWTFARPATCACLFALVCLFILTVGFDPFSPNRLLAQETSEGTLTEEEAEAKAEAELTAKQPDADSQEEGATGGTPQTPDVLQLLVDGGYLMLPIAFMSLLVVTFGVERLLGLRRHRVLPPELIDGLGQLASQRGGLRPREAYKLCQQYPSAASNVIKSMLLKIGRPHSELEHAVSEANEREASRLYTNVRWLGLAAGISPLMGLLGTVWGMIQAFYVTTNLPVGANKSIYLSKGIYIALMTTFAGLCVAIPAAVLAHIFEGRIQKLLRELDETLLGLMPQLERFEGRMRSTGNRSAQATPEVKADKPPKQAGA